MARAKMATGYTFQRAYNELSEAIISLIRNERKGPEPSRVHETSDLLGNPDGVPPNTRRAEIILYAKSPQDGSLNYCTKQ